MCWLFRMPTFVYSSLQETSEQKQQVKTERSRRCGRSRFSMMALRIWKDWRMSATQSNRNQELLEKGVSGSGKIDE
jgi:hypothetical protein